METIDLRQTDLCKKGTSLAYVTKESGGGLASDTLQPGASLPGAALFSALVLWLPCGSPAHPPWQLPQKEAALLERSQQRPQPVSTALTVGGPRELVSLSPGHLAVMPRPGLATCREGARGWSEPRAWWGGRRVAEPPGAVPEAETVTPISVLVRHVVQTVLCQRHPGPFISERKQMRH